MQIGSIRKLLEAFECKFEPFERDLKHSNANSNHSKGFQSILMKLEPFERDSKHSNGNANHSKGIRSILIEILTIRMKFKAFECKFEPFERDWNLRIQIRTI